MNRSVLIVAGGSGMRMGADIPKQFLPLAGVPVLIHTINKFFRWETSLPLVLVLPEDQFGYWEKIAEEFLPASARNQISLSPGGKTRTESVHNGLEKLAGRVGNAAQTLVAIHDGVRPFVNDLILQGAFEMAEKQGASVACVPVKASIREITQEGNSRAVDRTRFLEVQTPQTFRLEEILYCYRNRPEKGNFTDDASLYELTGKTVAICPGSYDNIKITTPEDMLVAEGLMR
ncbi:MAG: 2-C-methyl-D-erythritol 4-phosphate cytidylyltransferase [Bacteroidia bacterium]|nr:2-C-methyl-D-erythritol 4-phosphate cytidylyltransferase [Bacteroidia bacterium]